MKTQTRIFLDDGDIRQAIADYVKKTTGRTVKMYWGSADGVSGAVSHGGTTGLKLPFVVEVE